MRVLRFVLEIGCSAGWLCNGWYLADAWKKQAPVDPFITWILIACCGAFCAKLFAEAIDHAIR